MRSVKTVFKLDFKQLTSIVLQTDILKTSLKFTTYMYINQIKIKILTYFEAGGGTSLSMSYRSIMMSNILSEPIEREVSLTFDFLHKFRLHIVIVGN